MNSFLADFYSGKKVLITGHTGFKGSWLSLWLHELGAEVIGYALDPANQNDNFVLAGVSDFVTDIRSEISSLENVKRVFQKYRPEIVFHLAAQPLVRRSFQDPLHTYRTNIMGSLNVLETIRMTAETRVGVIITSDKCYQNNEWIWGYREIDPVGGYDPYSASKGCVEIIASSYLNSFFNPEKYEQHGKTIATTRAGNVIGGGDWSTDRLIPDCIRALEQERTISIHNPHAIRPWQHVLEPLGGYLLLAAKLWTEGPRYSGPWNFGPAPESVVTVGRIVDKLIQYWGGGKWESRDEEGAPHESTLLNLDVSKAMFQLDWKPRWSLETALEKTVAWYKNYQGGNTRRICLEQIKEYMDSDCKSGSPGL
jgi:CDP-glucose 4,6-dehydratase